MIFLIVVVAISCVKIGLRAGDIGGGGAAAAAAAVGSRCIRVVMPVAPALFFILAHPSNFGRPYRNSKCEI